MARCVTFRQEPGLVLATRLTFHDEAILHLLQDSSRPLPAPEAFGIKVSYAGEQRRIQMPLGGAGSCSIRQVCMVNSGSRLRLFFWGAALVPPVSAEGLSIQLHDDFGVCESDPVDGLTDPGRFLAHMVANTAVRGELPGTALISSATPAPPGLDPQALQWQQVEQPTEKAETVDINEADGQLPQLEDALRGLAACQAQLREKDDVRSRCAMEVQVLASELRRASAARDEALASNKVLGQTAQESADELRCVVCPDRRRAVAFLPCGHLVSIQNTVPVFL